MRFRKSIKKKGLKVKIDIQTDAGRLHKRKKKRLVYGLALAVVVCICSLGLFLLNTQGKQKSPEKAKADLEQILNVNSTTKNLSTVQSRLGVQISYNPEPIQVYGYVIDENSRAKTYEGDELKEAKDYAIFQVYVKQDYSNKDLPYGDSVELNIITNKNMDFFDRRKAEHGANLSELELTIKHFAPKESTLGSKITEKERSQVKINDVEYTRIVYEEVNSKYFKTTKYSEYLYTVQNNRPFAINISNITTENRAAIDPLYDVLNTIVYYPLGEPPAKNLSDSTLAYGNDSVDESANVPNELEDGTALTIAARNLPSVVRIGTIICADIDLLINKKVHSSYKGSCNAGVGSGSIISSDGYISTNGHVTVLPERQGLLNRVGMDSEAGNTQTIDNYLDFLYQSGVMSESQTELMLSGLASGDKTAIDKLLASVDLIPSDSLRISNSKSQYVVQLSNEPIRLNTSGGLFSFDFSDSKVEAKFIDGDYDPSANLSSLDGIKSDMPDVSILKIDKSNLPLVNLGSVDALKEGDLITAMGFPGFVDGGLDTKKDKTVASITQGSVESIYFDSTEEKRKLVISDTPISEGNSGGPAFSLSGDQLGLNTYGDQGTCGDGNCFSYYSVFTDAANLKSMIDKNKITLNNNSEFQSTWNEAIELFGEGKYSKAIPLIEKSKEIYPNNYLADSLLEKAKEGAESEPTSSDNIFFVVFIVGLLGSIAFTIMIVKHHKKGVGINPQTFPQAQQPQPYVNQPVSTPYPQPIQQTNYANQYAQQPPAQYPNPAPTYSAPQPAQPQPYNQVPVDNAPAAQTPPPQQENIVFPEAPAPAQPQPVDSGQQLQQPHSPGQVFRPEDPQNNNNGNL